MTAASRPSGLWVEDLPGLAQRDRTVELIEGELFISLPPTPFLREVIDHIADVLRASLLSENSGVEVGVELPLILGPRTRLTPDVLVQRIGGEAEADLVVEVRTESTDRFALGPKRMAYSRARIPEYWFYEPVMAKLHVFRFDAALPDYPWPPLRRVVGDSVELLRASGTVISVGDLAHSGKDPRFSIR